MRKTIVLLICLACGFAAFAQKTQEVFFSIGVMPYDYLNGSSFGYYNSSNDLYDSYETQYWNTMSSGMFELEYHRFLTDRIRVGGCAAYCYSTADLYDPVEDAVIGNRRTNNLFLTAQVRFCYMHTEKGELYSGAGAGAKLSLNSYSLQQGDQNAGLAGEVILIGLAYGRKVPVYFECVVGNTQAPYRFGIGYKF